MATPEAHPHSSPPGPAKVPGLDDPNITLYGLLLESSVRLQQAFARSLERHCELPLVQFEVLLRLGRSPTGVLSMSGLAGLIALTSGGVTRLVDRMETAGLVARQACPSDRRITQIGLTPAGERTLAEAVAVHREDLEREMRSRLTDRDAAALDRILRILREGYGSDTPP